MISAKIEQEIASLSDETEKKEFLETLGITETGLSKIIKEGYKLLNLITFFTIGPKEAHAWTVEKGAKAPEAAGVIHSDFQKGFIRAEAISTEDNIKFGGEAGARENGKPALSVKPSKADAEKLRVFNMLQLLTSKPVLYVCNVDEESCANGNELSKRVFD